VHEMRKRIGLFSLLVSLLAFVLVSSCFVCHIISLFVLLRGKELISFSQLVLEAGFLFSTKFCANSSSYTLEAFECVSIVI
jgi:hypothetical protein